MTLVLSNLPAKYRVFPDDRILLVPGFLRHTREVRMGIGGEYGNKTPGGYCAVSGAGTFPMEPGLTKHRGLQ